VLKKRPAGVRFSNPLFMSDFRAKRAEVKPQLLKKLKETISLATLKVKTVFIHIPTSITDGGCGRQPRRRKISKKLSANRRARLQYG
jgi:hypothetical protein